MAIRNRRHHRAEGICHEYDAEWECDSCGCDRGDRDDGEDADRAKQQLAGE
jgi:hypothetical protein